MRLLSLAGKANLQFKKLVFICKNIYICNKHVIRFSYCRYYEWQKKDGKKQPYFVYMPQGVSTEVEDVKTEDTKPSSGEYPLNVGLYHRSRISWGVTLAQLVKASVGQADVQRFEPHLGRNWLSCGVFLVKSRHLAPSGTNNKAKLAPSGTNNKAKLAISLSGWLGRYTNVEYLESLYLKR